MCKVSPRSSPAGAHAFGNVGLPGKLELTRSGGAEGLLIPRTEMEHKWRNQLDIYGLRAKLKALGVVYVDRNEEQIALASARYSPSTAGGRCAQTMRAPVRQPSFPALSLALLFGVLLALAFADIADLHAEFAYSDGCSCLSTTVGEDWQQSSTGYNRPGLPD
jgi:hypothetical protein